MRAILEVCFGSKKLPENFYMKIFKKKWFWFLVVVIAGAVWWFFGRGTEVVYETETVRRGDIAETISVSGTLEPDNSVEVSFETSGTMQKLFVAKGEEVRAGDVLAKMDDGVLLAQKNEAILGVKTAVQQEQLARRHWDDLKPEEREIKKLASESARASLATLEKSIAKTVLRAPVSGKVTRTYAEAGEVVTMSSPVVQIATGDTTAYIEADVPESDVSKLALGQSAKITFDALSKKDIFHAKIVSLDPRATVVSDVVYYTTKFSLEDGDDRLKTGMSADADVETDHRSNVLLVSRRAIKEDDGGVYVEVYDGTNAPVRREVETGLENDEGDVEVVKGLSEGEKVVVGGGGKE